MGFKICEFIGSLKLEIHILSLVSMDSFRVILAFGICWLTVSLVF